MDIYFRFVRLFKCMFHFHIQAQTIINYSNNKKNEFTAISTMNVIIF